MRYCITDAIVVTLKYEIEILTQFIQFNEMSLIYSGYFLVNQAFLRIWKMQKKYTIYR